jgi:hypothetical protein
MQLKIGDLFASPDHHLHAFEGDQAVFLDMDRAAYERSIFVDGRIQPASRRMLRVPVAPLVAFNDQLQPGSTPAPGWIFHVAHCGSTLLARALDRPGRSLSIREPMPLRQLGVEAACGRPPPGDWAGRLRLARTLLGRRYADPEGVVVKANVPVNALLPALTAGPDARAVALYFPLESYLVAVLRSPNHRRWVDSVTAELAAAIGPELAGVGPATTAQRAAALWMFQIRAFERLLADCPGATSLDADTLFETPRESVSAAADLFGTPFDARTLDAVVEGPLFARYSKNPNVAFSNTDRRARRAALLGSLSGDLRSARELVEARMAIAPLPDRLARPLAGEAPSLLQV